MKKEKLLEMLQCSDISLIELACSIWIREFGIEELEDISVIYVGGRSDNNCIRRRIEHNGVFSKADQKAIFMIDNIALLLYSRSIYVINNLSSFIKTYSTDWSSIDEKRRFIYEK